MPALRAIICAACENWAKALWLQDNNITTTGKEQLQKARLPSLTTFYC